MPISIWKMWAERDFCGGPGNNEWTMEDQRGQNPPTSSVIIPPPKVAWEYTGFTLMSVHPSVREISWTFWKIFWLNSFHNWHLPFSGSGGTHASLALAWDMHSVACHPLDGVMQGRHASGAGTPAPCISCVGMRPAFSSLPSHQWSNKR